MQKLMLTIAIVLALCITASGPARASEQGQPQTHTTQPESQKLELQVQSTINISAIMGSLPQSRALNNHDFPGSVWPAAACDDQTLLEKCGHPLECEAGACRGRQGEEATRCIEACDKRYYDCVKHIGCQSRLGE